jgi:AraC-like DNA-binding protein
MHGSTRHHSRIAPNAAAAAAVAALFVDECDRDMPGVSLPRSEVHLIARFGPSTRRGLDVHALGLRQRVHRKLLRSGHRAVTARLHLGAHEAVLGVPASALGGGIIALEQLWGDAATRRLFDRLGDARNANEAAAILESAIAERLAIANGRRARTHLALDAAERLTTAKVSAVAADLQVSERHLRRVFRETVGMGPKAFARLARFSRALRAARESDPVSWAGIAAATGYYDQAHLIAEFRAIAGATPQELLGELRAAVSIG